MSGRPHRTSSLTRYLPDARRPGARFVDTTTVIAGSTGLYRRAGVEEQSVGSSRVVDRPRPGKTASMRRWIYHESATDLSSFASACRAGIVQVPAVQCRVLLRRVNMERQPVTIVNTDPSAPGPGGTTSNSSGGPTAPRDDHVRSEACASLARPNRKRGGIVAVVSPAARDGDNGTISPGYRRMDRGGARHP